MSVSKLALWVLLMQLPLRAALPFTTDSLFLKEIADSLGVPVTNNLTRIEGERVVSLAIYYQGQRGAIPAALGGLDSLHRIYMGITGVTSLPREIGRLKRMDTIDIGSSAIGPRLPDEIGELTNLRVLKVSSCRLETLPASLMKLQKLERLDFTSNQICSLDDSLRLWILAKWPKALDRQRTSNCASTSIGHRPSPPSDSPLRRLWVPGARALPLEQDPAAKDTHYYTPLGRGLKGQISLPPPGADARE